MEDEDSKTRRNLLAACTVVLLIWWLQAPLDKMTEKLLNVPSVAPTFEWRAWLAATVAIVYFALRFRFSLEHAKAIEDRNSERSEVRRKLLIRWLNLEGRLYARFGVKSWILADALPPLVDLTEADGSKYQLLQARFSDITLGWRDRLGQISPLAPGEVRGMVDLYVEHRIKGGMNSRLHKGLGFELIRAQRWLLSAMTWTWLLIYSKTSTSLAVPWVFTIAALGICGHQQWKTW